MVVDQVVVVVAAVSTVTLEDQFTWETQNHKVGIAEDPMWTVNLAKVVKNEGLLGSRTGLAIHLIC